MPDHLHLISDSVRSSADTLRFVNGIIGRRIIDHEKDRGHKVSLQKLRHETKKKDYRYSVFDHHPNVRLLLTEKMLMERVHYTHQNPVRAGLVERAEDTGGRVSVAGAERCWRMSPCEWISIESSGGAPKQLSPSNRASSNGDAACRRTVRKGSAFPGPAFIPLLRLSLRNGWEQFNGKP